ncbi:hypothetical protein BAUCODRAFT_26822 [Baudoinia panamericana UAMH 10762]|uniref:Uncharacterized protein n=1 Tax=Baudoinia panamericana (strain UAMH 10762) TaxID=717646 RepID=M2N4E0_BAUPA|nr:uncharacterized protein BAUCODRAFT_26822 [Baudoinia panamericana UAMH 10762]EMC93560.1 hypothetical protein BAUCODRAFT_26822 [Baudoinia panamericana UAMH 10762]
MQTRLLSLLLVSIAFALPQDTSNCVTVTHEVIVPTSTHTYTSTHVTTIHATTADDLGTFTLVTTESSTKTLMTLTTTSAVCTAYGTIINRDLTRTVYTTAGSHTTDPLPTASPDPTSDTCTEVLTPTIQPTARPLGLHPRQTNFACTVTTTWTTTYGFTFTFVAVPNQTTTFTDYTAFTLATTTLTVPGGTAYTIATATATTTPSLCGSATVNASTPTTTTITTHDVRCAPTALTSAYNGYGLEYIADTPTGGAHFTTNTTDGSTCCQLCAEASCM